jgi:flagellin
MSLSILNDISALAAQYSLSVTQSNLQKTLQQLSSGMKVNSGADDPACLSIASGLNANIAALTQSGQNATNAIGLLQTADGALSQVTSMLNRAATLATEASSGGLTTSQAAALNNEFQSILSSINNIGSDTTFNGSAVFTNDSVTPFLSDGTAGNDLLGSTTMEIGKLNTTALQFGTTTQGATNASNTLTLGSTNLTPGTTLDIGGTNYTMIANGQSANLGQIQLGSGSGSAGANATLTNIAAAVNGTDGVNTTANANVSAGTVNTVAGSLTFTARVAGSTGNSQVVSSTGVGTGSAVAGSWGNLTLTGGVDQTFNNPSSNELDFGGNPSDGDTITIDGTTYTFESNLTANNSAPNQVSTYGDNMDDAQYLADVINGIGDSGECTAGTTPPGGGISAFYNQGMSVVLTASSGSNTLTVNSSDLAAASFQNPTFQGGSTAAPAAQATGTLTLTYNPPANSTVTIGSNTYVFGAATGSQISVALGNNAAATLTSLATAIGNNDGASLTASANGNTLTLTAVTAGAAGNSIVTAFNAAGALSGTTLTGGADFAPATTWFDMAGGNIQNNETITLGNVEYTFVNSFNGGANQVLLGANYTDAMTNLGAAINGGGGGKYSGNTQVNTEVTAGTVEGSGDVCEMMFTTTPAAEGDSTPASCTNNSGNLEPFSGGSDLTPATGTLTQTNNEAANDTVTVGGTTYTFQTAPITAAGQVQIGGSPTLSLANLAAAIDGSDHVNAANANVTASVNGTTLTFAANSANAGSAGNNVTMTSGSTNSDSVSTTVGNWSGPGGTLTGGNDATTASTTDLSTPADAQAALIAVADAINIVSQVRGTVGANMNQFTAASSVMTSQVQNLQGAESGIMDADIGKTVARMTRYNTLMSTGIAALQQSNQSQQAVLKLLQ